jgi:tetratricopeptide (TPR) repeat protein
MFTTKAFSHVSSFLALCVLGAILYSNTFHNSFHFDDFSYILGNPAITDPGNLKALFTSWPSRFLGLLSFALNYRLHQSRVLGYHAVNIALHISAAYLVFWLAKLLFSFLRKKKEEVSTKETLLSLFAALIFLVHPIQTQALNYIFQRVTILGAICYVGSLCLYAVAMQRLRGTGRVNIYFYAGSLLVAFMGMFAKENVGTLPFMILGFHFYFLRDEKAISWKYTLPFLLLLPVIPLAVCIAKPSVFSDVERFWANPSAHAIRYLYTQVRVIVTYLRLLVLPVGQNIDYDYPLVQTLWSMPVLLSLFVEGVLIAVGFRTFARYRLLSFGIFWFFLALLPESSIIPLLDVIYEHRLYLPLFGFAIFIIGLVYYFCIGKRFKPAMVILVTFILLCSIATYRRNRIWVDELSLWDDAVHKSPAKVRPYNERGIAFLGKKMYALAAADFARAVQLDPGFVRGYYNRAVTYSKMNQYERAIADYSEAIRIEPGFPSAHLGRGQIYFIVGERRKAIADFKEEISLNAQSAVAQYNLAVAYYHEKEYSLALQSAEHALRLGYAVDPKFMAFLRSTQD